VGFAVWTVAVDDPLGGEPVAIASVGHPAPGTEKVAQSASSADAAKPPAVQTPANADAAKTVTVIDGMSGKREQFTIAPSGAVEAAGVTPGRVTVTPAKTPPEAIAKAAASGVRVTAGAPEKAAGGTPPAAEKSTAAAAQSPAKAPAEGAKASAADPRLAEVSRHGVIPKMGSGGVRASEVYASPLAAAAAASGGPQIALVIGRMGVSAQGTNDALSKLPAAVTVAFSPYGAGVDAAVARAREGGREVLLQVPMEPFDYPDNDPGPQTLLIATSPDQNVDRLHWFMSRFAGYVGIGNYMGARFAANEPAVSTVMREVAKRGLMYFDDGTATRSLVSQVAALNNVPFARADLIVDAGRSPAEIDAALARLEAMARERGSAVGMAIALPASIDHIAKWAASVGSRGITLVPISVIANKAKSS
jgi:polysaccharide deacetylase 2 family uncharacterized protein YibQ